MREMLNDPEIENQVVGWAFPESNISKINGMKLILIVVII